MSGSSYVQRAIDVTFTLQDGTFSGSGSNTLTVSGLRVRTTITRVGAPTFNNATASIFGLPLSVMNDLSTLGKQIANNKQNSIAIYAGDGQSDMGLVFAGTIFDAWANFESSPEVSFDVKAQTAQADSIAAISPSSYQGGADVATIIQAVASQMTPARAFENNGVSVHLANAYYPGTATDQIREAAADAGIFWEDDGQTISIWPPGGSKGGAVPIISPDTGLVGYPRYTRSGIELVTLFNRNIEFGGKVQVESMIKGATGTFCVTGMVHNLHAQAPNGDWFTAIRLVDPVIFSGGQYQ